MSRTRPLVVVHTGQMKGKSTAAFGMALRAWSAGLPIGVYQFVKGGKWQSGEAVALRALGEVHASTGQGAPVAWYVTGSGFSWTWAPGTEGDKAEQAVAAWQQVRRDLAKQRFGMLVLDEFTYPMTWGWIDVDEVVATLAERPGQQHVVITGRDADQRLVDAADLVVDMTKVKHPMDAGIKGQRGIEW